MFVSLCRVMGHYELFPHFNIIVIKTFEHKSVGQLLAACDATLYHQVCRCVQTWYIIIA